MGLEEFKSDNLPSDICSLGAPRLIRYSHTNENKISDIFLAAPENSVGYTISRDLATSPNGVDRFQTEYIRVQYYKKR